MTYTEKELKEIQSFTLNKDIQIQDLDSNKFYIFKVQIDPEASKEKIYNTLSNLKQALNNYGLTNILIVPMMRDIVALQIFELEKGDTIFEKID